MCHSIPILQGLPTCHSPGGVGKQQHWKKKSAAVGLPTMCRTTMLKLLHHSLHRPWWKLAPKIKMQHHSQQSSPSRLLHLVHQQAPLSRPLRLWQHRFRRKIPTNSHLPTLMCIQTPWHRRLMFHLKMYRMTDGKIWLPCSIRCGRMRGRLTTPASALLRSNRS